MTKKQNKPLPGLIDEHPILVYPKLAAAIGLNEAIICQQLHYLLNSVEEVDKTFNYVDDHWWVYFTLKEWHDKYFSWMAVGTIGRLFRKLEEQGLVVSMQSVKNPSDRTKWYRIDHGKWIEIIPPIVTNCNHQPLLQNVTIKNTTNCNDGYNKTLVKEKKKKEKDSLPNKLGNTDAAASGAAIDDLSAKDYKCAVCQSNLPHYTNRHDEWQVFICVDCNGELDRLNRDSCSVCGKSDEEEIYSTVDGITRGSCCVDLSDFDDDLSANDIQFRCVGCGDSNGDMSISIDGKIKVPVCVSCYESSDVRTCSGCGEYRKHSGGDEQAYCDDCVKADRFPIQDYCVFGCPIYDLRLVRYYQGDGNGQLSIPVSVCPDCQTVLDELEAPSKATMAEVADLTFGTRDNPVHVAALCEVPQPKAKKPRKRSAKQLAMDAMKNAMVAARGLDPDKISIWGEYNSAAKALIAAKATPEDMPGLKQYTDNDMDCKWRSPMAMATRWPEYSAALEKSKQQKQYDTPAPASSVTNCEIVTQDPD